MKRTIETASNLPLAWSSLTDSGPTNTALPPCYCGVNLEQERGWEVGLANHVVSQDEKERPQPACSFKSECRLCWDRHPGRLPLKGSAQVYSLALPFGGD